MTIELDIRAANEANVTIGPLTVWFSYRTPIAFQLDGAKRVARENSWGPTTGKHLNHTGVDQADRISGEAFEAALAAITANLAPSLLDTLSASVAVAS